MSKFFYAALIAILVLTAGISSRTIAQGADKFREITGAVHDQNGSPVKGANVQIQNEDTRAVQTYLTDADGAFHFVRLSKDVDYSVSAVFNGTSSKKVSISKFDDKPTKFVKLVIDSR